MKLGVCEKCGKPTDAAYEIRNNRVYLAKFCRECGRTASLVSKDARKWRWKRQITGYEEQSSENACGAGCSLDCATCDHQKITPPYTVGIDVTNRCNQKCPICLAYVDAMGYDYHPPVEYFDKIFRHFLHATPKPNMCFFGGEPTVHRDFPEIVRLARSYGFQVQLFTNGLKFADKEYCRELCSMGIQVNFGLDGTRPEIYRELRGDSSLAVKRKGLENIIECGVNKLAIISTIASGVNDDNMCDMLELIHEYREHVSVWAFVPLTPCWESENVQLEPTTTECVENIFEGISRDIELVPTGMMKFDVLSRFFGRQTLGGSHPNCESATLLVSDGKRYHPISRYLKMPLSELLVKLRKLDTELVTKQARVRSRAGRMVFALKTIVKTLGMFGRSLDFRAVFGERYILNAILAGVDLARGRKMDRILSERTAFKNLLTLLTIPYEDTGGLDNARLKDCPAVFAYEDVSTGAVKTTAFCSWQTIKDDVCRKIGDYYHGMQECGEMVEESAEGEMLPKVEEGC